jgi:putative DNA primase/helicase
LPDKLEAELPGIMNWAVEGCLEWQRDGLRPPKKVADATRVYRSDMDMLAQFLDDACVVEASEKVSAKDLYANFQQWCDDNGYEPLSQTALGHRLKARGFLPVRDRSKRSWAGLRLRTPADDFESEVGVEATNETGVHPTLERADDEAGN